MVIDEKKMSDPRQHLSGLHFFCSPDGECLVSRYEADNGDASLDICCKERQEECVIYSPDGLQIA